MSESTWGDAEAAPPKKKGVPTWLWFCGGGCLLAVIVGIVAVTWFAGRVKDWTNPEKQWPKVAELLPYDERPPELELQIGIDMLGMHVFSFHDSRGFQAALFSLSGSSASERNKAMDPNASTGLGPLGARKDAQAFKVTVQGRELDALRFFQMAKGSETAGQPDSGAGPSALVDLTPQDASGFVLLQLTRTSGTEAVTDEEIQTFLKPFHVGPVR